MLNKSSVPDIHATLRARPRDFSARLVKNKWCDRLSTEELATLSLSTKEVKRQEIINEIIVTEKEYLDDLKFVHKTFWKPAREINVREEVMRLFSNIEDMIRLHEHIHMCLLARQLRQAPVVVAISDMFLPFVERFDIYASYLVNYTPATECIEKMKKTADPFAVFVKNQEQLPACRKLPLQAFLIAPVQRLAKYPLLFKGLLDNTLPESPDFEPTGKLYQEMDAFIRKLEDAKRRDDNFARLMQLEDLVKGLGPFKLAVFERDLICEGCLNQVDLTKKPQSPSCTATVTGITSNTNGILPMYVLLFSDIVLWTQRIRERNRKDSYKLLEPPSRITHVEDMPDRKGLHNLFKCTSVHSGKAEFVLQATSSKDKAKWLHSVHAVLRQHTNRDETLDQWLFYNHMKETSRKSTDENFE